MRYFQSCAMIRQNVHTTTHSTVAGDSTQIADTSAANSSEVATATNTETDASSVYCVRLNSIKISAKKQDIFLTILFFIVYKMNFDLTP